MQTSAGIGSSFKTEQAVWESTQYAPAPVHLTLQPSSSPYTPYACGAQCALRHEYHDR